MITHRKINNLLSVLVVVLGLYLIVAPFLPSISFWWQKRAGFDVPYYAKPDGSSEKPPTDSRKPGNRVAIPSIGLDEQIFEGQGEYTANKGVWRRPNTAKPGQDSNTVLAGHRFSYSPAVHDPFYNLDKVKIGDSVVLLWDNEPVRYKVVEIKVVNPEDVYIENGTDSERLTVYTCTPLWTSKQRLVLIAEPEEQ